MVLLATSCGSKAEFTLGPPELNPTTAIIGQEVTVSVDVSNIGKAKGIYEAVLNVDGVNTETRSVTLAPGATQTVIFKLIKRDVGTYTVKFGDQSRTLTVVKPAEFTVGSLSISPEEVVQGKETTISVDVRNIGGVEGDYSCTLVLSGVNIQTKTICVVEFWNHCVRYVSYLLIDAYSSLYRILPFSPLCKFLIEYFEHKRTQYPSDRRLAEVENGSQEYAYFNNFVR
jgi:hypothetical protein